MRERPHKPLRFGVFEQILDCPECGAPMELVDARQFGRPFYACQRYPKCSGSHGAHPDGEPLGIPADQETKEARSDAHALFDQIWRTGIMGRGKAYRWMQKTLKLSKKDAHISRLNKTQCAVLQKKISEQWPHLHSSVALREQD